MLTIILFHACYILFLSYILGYERSDNGNNEAHVEIEIYHRNGILLGIKRLISVFKNIRNSAF